MSRWFGKVGYANNTELEPGLWVDEIVERSYYGEMVSNKWRRQSSSNVNDDIILSSDISILADPYAKEHCSNIVYVVVDGSKWKVTNVDIQRPRLVLTLGGVWNGQQN